MDRLARYKELFFRFVDPKRNEHERDEAELAIDMLWPQLTPEEQALAERYHHQLAEEEMR